MDNEIENEVPVIDEKQMDIEWQFNQYLEKVHFSKLLMHPVQLQETQRAFMGGMAQMLLIWINDLPMCTDEKVDEYITKLSFQIGNFFTNESNKPLIVLP